MYLLNAIFLLVFRPYTNIMQNVFCAASDLAFFIIVVLAFASESSFYKTSVDAKEKAYGGAQMAMVFIIFFVTLVNFILPILKAHDSHHISHQSSDAVKEHSDNEELQRRTSSIKQTKEPEEYKSPIKEQKLIEHATIKEELGQQNQQQKYDSKQDLKNNRLTEGSEFPLNREEQLPMRPKETENPALKVGKRKLDIAGHSTHKENTHAEGNNYLGDVERSNENHSHLNPAKDQPPTAQNSFHQPKRNNLVGTNIEPVHSPDVNLSQPVDRLNPASSPENKSPQLGKTSELPPVKGKLVIKKPTKVNVNVSNQDFDGM